MTVHKHTEQAKTVLDLLVKCGFSPEIQQRMGAFSVIWSVFESNIESTLWLLQDENVKGVRPSTDKSSVSEWIKVFGKGSSKFDQDVQEILQIFSLTAIDLMEYRHALVHGSIIPFASGPICIRNPQWNGEHRKRKFTEAHIDSNLLDLAIDTAWVLCQIVFATCAAYNDSSKSNLLLSLKSDLARVRSQAFELRHLTELMNHEKY